MTAILLAISILSTANPANLSISSNPANPGDTTLDKRRFSKQQLNEDVSYLTTVVNRVHPDMYHNIDKERYQLLTERIRNSLYDGMTAREAWAVLTRLIGALNEGHSIFDFPDGVIDQLKNSGPVLFPLSISGFDGENLVVRADRSNENKLLPGDLITSINGINASRLIDTLSGYAGGLKTFRALDVCRNIIICLCLYNFQSPYKIGYLHDGKPGTISLKAVSWPELTANGAARLKNAIPQPGQDDYKLTYLDGNSACLTINSLTEKPEIFQHFLDSCFIALKAKPVGKLIIDLRRNGGGNSVLGEKLLGYIANRPFRMTGGERWKVSQEYKDQIQEKQGRNSTPEMTAYFNTANGNILPIDGGRPKKPSNNPLLYTGRVFVLIGPNTFSSANMLANTIQDFELATLVGEPTGEPANDYGELIFLKLPNTGFRFSTSTKQFIRANGDPVDPHPVLPRYRIADNPTTPVDEALEFTKAL